MLKRVDLPAAGTDADEGVGVGVGGGEVFASGDFWSLSWGGSSSRLLYSAGTDFFEVFDFRLPLVLSSVLS